MTPNQFDKLIDVLDKSINYKYTLTGASDWPLLVAIASIIFVSLGVIAALIVYIHQDLKSYMRDKDIDLMGHIEQEVKDRKTAINQESKDRRKAIFDEKEERKLSIQQCYDNWRLEKNDIWTSFEKCQSDCCPRGSR